MSVLTVYSPSPQTSPGKHPNNLDRLSCVAHNVSNTGSSKLLQQHAKQTAVASLSEVTSSQAMNLTISSTLRQWCIEPRGCVWPCIDEAPTTWQLTFKTTLC